MVKRTWAGLLCALVMVISAGPAAAQDAASEPDEEGCKDSALVTRMKGCRILSCEAKDFDAYDAVVGAYSSELGDYPRKALEGRIERLDYVCAATLSGLQVARNMENALKAAGFKIVHTNRDGQTHYLTVNKGAQWLEILTEPWNSQIHYVQTAVLVQAMEQEVVADATAMGNEIDKSGSVALYGINFDTGRATLQPGSEGVLGEIVKLLRERSDWRLEVQGHTDNVGQPAANARLSQGRAHAVVDWLVKNGVEASRLEARGYGDTMPVEDNATEEGRAKNRRVQLKKLHVE